MTRIEFRIGWPVSNITSLPYTKLLCRWSILIWFPFLSFSLRKSRKFSHFFFFGFYILQYRIWLVLPNRHLWMKLTTRSSCDQSYIPRNGLFAFIFCLLFFSLSFFLVDETFNITLIQFRNGTRSVYVYVAEQTIWQSSACIQSLKIFFLFFSFFINWSHSHAITILWKCCSFHAPRRVFD